MSAARTKSKKSKKRTHRYTSNVFSMFNQAQIQEFKEAFNMIDQNRDGFIDKDDLIEMLTSLGKNPEDQLLDHMINEAPGAINFTMFLTLFGEKLQGTDPEDVIKNAFGCFDDKTIGKIGQDYLREIMTTMGDRWTDEMVDELFYGAPINDGVFDYIEFTRMLKHGARDKDDEPMETPQAPLTPKSPSKFAFTPPCGSTSAKFPAQNVGGASAAPPAPKKAAVTPLAPPPKPSAVHPKSDQSMKTGSGAAEKPFWKKPKAKSPPPPAKPRSPPPKPKQPLSVAKTQPAEPKSPPTAAGKPPGSMTSPTSPGGSKPELPSSGKPQLPTLKSVPKPNPFQGNLKTPPLKTVLKPTMKGPPK